MQMSSPKFWNSKYYDPKTNKLLTGAPSSVKKEYKEYCDIKKQMLNESKKDMLAINKILNKKGKNNGR